MYKGVQNESVGVNPASNEPKRALVDKAIDVHEKLNTVVSMAEIIHGELFGHFPCEGGCEPNDARFSLDESITKIEYSVTRAGDCLEDILRRLRG